MDPECRKRIERLYQSELKQEPDRRASFLAAVCGGDEDLRRQVAALLAESVPTGVLEEASGWEDQFETHLAPGAKLGPYQIAEPLGEGGMGKV